MTASFIRSIRLDGFLSFAPGSAPIELRPLNVVIGPNGSGKSNFLEAFSLLTQLPLGDTFQISLREGGGASEWLWKGGAASTIELELNGDDDRRFSYKVRWAPHGPGSPQATFLEESFRELQSGSKSAMTYFSIEGGQVEIATQVIGRNGPEPYTTEKVPKQYFSDNTSILSQRNTPGAYPDNIWLARQFARMENVRDWTFGPTAAPRAAQGTDMPSDSLLPGASNLGMMLQELQHRVRIDELNDWIRRFLPRASRLTTRTSGGRILAYLHEDGASDPIPATRLSDGTLRFISLLVVLLAEPAPPLVCIEEPELGLHPDALSLIADLLVEASTRTQLIVTTHSDALISALTEHVESVLVCEHLGGSRLERLEAAKLKHWLEKYRLGEIWRIGKLGGNP